MLDSLQNPHILVNFPGFGMAGMPPIKNSLTPFLLWGVHIFMGGRPAAYIAPIVVAAFSHVLLSVLDPYMDKYWGASSNFVTHEEVVEHIHHNRAAAVVEATVNGSTKDDKDMDALFLAMSAGMDRARLRGVRVFAVAKHRDGNDAKSDDAMEVLQFDCKEDGADSDEAGFQDVPESRSANSVVVEGESDMADSLTSLAAADGTRAEQLSNPVNAWEGLKRRVVDTVDEDDDKMLVFDYEPRGGVVWCK
eukprot:CAMPEP_0196740300 /NCGR_PEP_ID=MMETSP1091-20130531/31172_1 /TAXON_ID=302021 /ORGANISM="Rhodomonas sp., Strain CCMP768" /LENGTH=248 /DNA_ID=CAMNT_0042085383 /DNA_START=420 /DNA_END=1166 /DNA_ORIENTATION=+